MKKTTLTFMITLFTATSMFSGLSHAEGPGQPWHQDRGHDPRADDRPGGDRHYDRGGDDRGDDRHHGGPRERDRFAWNGHDFRRGYPAPERFRGDDYRVDDWRDRGLYAPPRGAHWARVDGNYVLIAAATGVITAIIIDNLLGDR